MSESDQAIATFEWYRRPDLGEQESSRLQVGGDAPESGLCGECASLTQNMLGARLCSCTSHNGQEDIDGGFDTSEILDEGYTFQKPYSQVRGDVNFCALCRAIQDSVYITQTYAVGHCPTQIPPGSTVRLCPDFDNDDGVLNGFNVIVHRDENASETDSETTRWRGFLEVQVRETEPSRVVDNLSSSDAVKGREAVTIRRRRFRKGVLCRNMTQMLHSWLRECDSAHDVCRDHKNPCQNSTGVDTSASPSRLLGIQQVDRRLHIRLVAGTENRMKYVALSHRWGDYRCIRTTTLNIESYWNEINFDSLPLTLQEAVQITYAAGVRHLWVDCLCIIQDDDNDWALEAPRMGSIYASAYFTIAASAFEDAGCFPIKFTEDQRVMVDVYPGLVLNIYPRSFESKGWSIQDEPLQKRGWTLQERLLSQRILYCSRYEYYWLCRERRLRAWGYSDSWCWYGSLMADGLPLLLSYSTQSRRTALTQWYLLLFDYSNRKLTLEKDKLIAINGLASIFQRWIGSRYLHGLWECDLAFGLVWRLGGRTSPEFSDTRSGSKLKTFEHEKSRFWRTRSARAPSWSWASADGFRHPSESDLNWLADRLGQPLSELVYVKATVASDDEQRSCLGGHFSAGPQVLKITGRLSKAFYGYENADEQSNRGWQINGEGGPWAFEFVADDPNFDTDEYTTDAENPRLYVLPIIAYMGLVITPAGDDDARLYRRVGYADLENRTPFQKDFYSDKIEGSTIGTADSDTEHATAQTADRAIEALGSTNKTDTETCDEGADDALFTAEEPRSLEDSINSEGTSDDAARDRTCWDYIADELRWLGEVGACETIFLC